MIQINDTDMPIQVAEKIIGGTMVVKVEEDEVEIDMFELKEIKEIAGYLMTYYDTHKNGD